MAGVVELDGTTLEGGGQLVRIALALSSLSNIPISITKIRGNRSKASKPGVAGGLKGAHLAAVKWLGSMTDAEITGAELGSTELSFKPRRKFGEVDIAEIPDIWKPIHEDGKLVRYQTLIPMSTAGSITLVLQAVLPYILFLSSPVPLRLVIEGGTNVDKSPSIEYTSQVLLSMLSSQLKLPPIAAQVLRRGWSTGRADPGSIAFDIPPIAVGATIGPFTFRARETIEKIHVSSIMPDAEDRMQVRDALEAQLSKILPGADVEYPVDEISGNPQRCYLLLVGETASGYRLGSDELAPRKAPKGRKRDEHEKRVANRHLVTDVVDVLHRVVTGLGCVDEHMEDQLVIFQALASGPTSVKPRSPYPSLRTQTARWVAQRILGVEFDANGDCRGTSMEAGQCSRRLSHSQEGQL